MNINTVYCMRTLSRYSPELFLSAPVGLDSLFFFSILPVDLLLKAVGDTPIMKQKKWAVERGRTVQSLSQFISRFLKLDAGEQLVRRKLVGFTKKLKSDHTTSQLHVLIFVTPQFIYVNQSFAPSPDQDVGVLFDVSTHSDLHLITRKWIGKTSVFLLYLSLWHLIIW